MTTNDGKPREFWIQKHSGGRFDFWSSEITSKKCDDHDFSNAIHVIEMLAYEAVRKERDELAAKCANQETFFDEHKSQIADMERKLRNVSAELEEARKDLEDVFDTKIKLYKKIDELRAELEESKKHSQEIIAALVQQREELRIKIGVTK